MMLARPIVVTNIYCGLPFVHVGDNTGFGGSISFIALGLFCYIRGMDKNGSFIS